MVKQSLIVTNVAQLVSLMQQAKAGGQFVELYGETDYKFNKYPNGTLPKERTPEIAFAYQKNENGARVRKAWHISYNFAADYDTKFEKVFGVEHESHDENREHLVDNVVMRFKSTGNVCMIAMPNSRKSDGLLIDGNPATEEQIAYCERYEQPRTQSALPYLNVGVKNVRKVVINHTEYLVRITDTTYAPAEQYAAAAAV